VTENEINMELTGGELQLGKIEKKSFTRPKNKETREKFRSNLSNTAGNGAKIIKLPPPTSSLQQCAEQLKESGLYNNYFGQFLGNKVSFEGDKMVFNYPNEIDKKSKKKEEVECFGIQATTNDDDKTDPIKNQYIHYNIKYLPNKKVEVTAKYLTKEEKKWKNIKYKQIMDYNNFLLFIANKDLKPITKDEKKLEDETNTKIKKNAKAQLPYKRGEFFSIKTLLEGGKQLCKKFGKPIVSTSANISGEPAPSNFSEINPKILRLVDYVVNYRRDDMRKFKPSGIIRLEKNGVIKIIRE